MNLTLPELVTSTENVPPPVVGSTETLLDFRVIFVAPDDPPTLMLALFRSILPPDPNEVMDTVGSFCAAWTITPWPLSPIVIS